MSSLRNLNEKDDYVEDNDLSRLYARNPPRYFFQNDSVHQDPRDRQNPPRYPEHRGQDIDKKYK